MGLQEAFFSGSRYLICPVALKSQTGASFGCTTTNILWHIFIQIQKQEEEQPILPCDQSWMAAAIQQRG